MKIKAKDLKDTDKQLVETYYSLMDEIRKANPKMTKTEATEYSVIMTAKVYGRSILTEMERLQKQDKTIPNPN